MPAASQSRHAIDLTAPEFREMRREFAVDRAGINANARTVELSFASEQPVDRWYGREILELTPEACDLTRLKNGGAVLMDHDWRDQVGVVTDVRIDAGAKKGRATVKFSQSARGKEIFQDIQDGIRSLISVGYVVRKMVLQSVEGDVETHRVTDWQPHEISVVAVPADTSVGIGRSASTPAATTAAKPQPQTISRTMSDTPATPAAPVAPAVSVTNDFTAERQRIKDINTAAKTTIERHPQHADAIRSLASKCNETGATVADFGAACLNDILGTRTDLAPVTQGRAELGLDKKELKRYSLLNAITRKLNNQPLEGLELRAHEAEEKRLGRSAAGFFVPSEVLYSGAQARVNYSRELNATGAPSAGGYTIPETIDSNYIELLRNSTKVVGLGARMITGLQGNITIPRVLSGTTASWLSESGAVSSTTPTFGQIAMKPRRLASLSAYTKQFLAQTSISAEAFIRDDIFRSQAVELDRVAICGTGAEQPLGILNLASGDRSTSITFSGAATWAKYVEFFVNVLTNNALIGSPAFLTTPATMGKAMTITKFANTGMPIWADNNTIGGYRAEVTNQFPTSGTLNQVIFGDFSQVVYGQWVGNDVTVDPYTLLTTGQIRISVENLMDCVIRQGKAFAISSDTGAA
jgi:HK97 family phage major capsid protein/HK97 family phage prohead protease